MISIVIPLYNKEHCIRETLSSILSQSYKDFEIVVVNDGSKDDSVAVVNSINDNRLRLINKENEGVSKTRNRGLKEARGQWVLFFDADDLMCEGCLQALVDLSKQFPDVNVLCGNFITRTRNADIPASTIKGICQLHNPFKMILEKKWNFRLGSFIAKKEIIPFFPEHMAKGEDFIFFVNMIKNERIAYTPHITMIYILEYSDLSKKLLPLECCLSWNLTFKNTNTYLRSIYIDQLIKSILIYPIRHKNIAYSFSLIVRHFKGLVLYTPVYIYRKILSIIKND